MSRLIAGVWGFAACAILYLYMDMVRSAAFYWKGMALAAAVLTVIIILLIAFGGKQEPEE